jgi:hypothetical protein
VRRIEDLRLAFIELIGDVGLVGTYGDVWRLVVTGWE